MGGLLHQTKEPDILFGARRVPDLQSVTGSLIQTMNHGTAFAVVWQSIFLRHGATVC